MAPLPARVPQPGPPAPRRRRPGLLLLALLLCASLTACEWQFSSGGHDDDDDCDNNKDDCGGAVIVTESATFGGQDLANAFLAEQGVIGVERGWTGGWAPWVGPGLAPLTGHAAAVRVRFDPQATSYGSLLAIALAAREGSRSASTWPRGDLQLGTAQAQALWRGGGDHGPRLLVHPPAPFHAAGP